jgi:hypothetical protein
MKTRIEKIEEFLNSLHSEVDILNCIDVDSVNSYDDILSQIEDSNGFDIEIIYYHKAMDYLIKNDGSLTESLSIAADMGFEVKNLNSEVLASLLASQNAREEFYSLENVINEFFEELEEEEEETEGDEE